MMTDETQTAEPEQFTFDPVNVTVKRERFKTQRSKEDQAEFDKMFRDHGVEVRGRPMRLFLARYHSIEADGRLAWVVARHLNVPIGYSCHYVYYDMNFADKVSSDGIWYVKTPFRRHGIGTLLKKHGHEILRNMGAIRITDLIRSGSSEKLMRELGFKERAIQWEKELR